MTVRLVAVTRFLEAPRQSIQVGLFERAVRGEGEGRRRRNTSGGGRDAIALEAAKGTADVIVASNEHKCQTVSLKLKEETDVQPDADFPITMLQPLEAKPIGALASSKIVQETVHGVNGLCLPFT